MSFADVVPGRGVPLGPPGGAAAATEDEFASTARTVASSVFQLTTNVTSFKRLVDAMVRGFAVPRGVGRCPCGRLGWCPPPAASLLLAPECVPCPGAQGTPKDTRELRARLHRQRDALGQIAKDTTAAMKKLSELAVQPGAPPGAKATQTKLVKDFQAVLKEFQKAQRACAERESAYLPHSDAGRPLSVRGSGGSGSELPPYVDAEGSYQRSGSLEQQALLRESKRLELLQLDGEIEYNNALIAERDAGIAEIQSQIGEVNEIFQDLAVLVNEQGTMLDDIEQNIVRTSAKTRDARQELVKAETSQRAARSKLLWLLLIGVVILSIVILAVMPWGR